MAKLASTRVYGNLIVDNNLSVGSISGGLTISGSLTSGGGEPYSNYVAGADNIILKGSKTGVSGLFFESEKDGTSINHPSDYAFIQYHPHGIGGTSGESGRLVVGISNDAATDKIVLNPPGANDLVVRVGVGTTEHQVWHGDNDGSGSGLDADLLDGLHLNSTTTNNEANKVMRTDGSGYAKFDWIKTTSGNTNAAVSDVYVGIGDGFIYKKTLDTFKANLGTMPPGIHFHSFLIPGDQQEDLASDKLSWQQYSNSTSPDGGSWHHALRMQHGGYPVNGYYRELLMPFHSNSLYISHVANGAKTITKLATEDWVTSKIPSTSGAYELTKDKIETALKGASTDSIQLGQGSSAGPSSAALGAHASATGDGSIAIGIATTATGATSTVMGAGSSAKQESTALGANTYAGGSNSTALGCYASAGASNNTIQLGDASGLSTLRSRVNLSVTSDIRDKTDIAEIPKALDFIKDLNPITYVSNDREHYISDEQKETDTYKDYLMVEDYDRESHSQGTKKGSRRRVGLSAQEVRDKLIEHYGSNNYANVVNDNFVEFEERELDVPKDLENKLTMSYETMVPFLIKAIQEQQEQIEELKEKINKG